MISPTPFLRRLSGPVFWAALAGAGLLAGADGRAADDVLHVGTTGAITGKPGSPEEKTSLESLRSFIKDETGRDNDVTGPKTWEDLSAKMAAGQFQIGVFQGYEFAWARAKRADLKPLAVGVNVSPNPIACVLNRRDDPAADFAGLQGHSLSLLAANEAFLRLYLDKQGEAAGKKTDAFFSKITLADNAETQLDDLVDGNVQAAAVEKATLEAYQRRKPGRFKKLKVVACSQPFPPLIVAYYDAMLDDATVRSFRQSLLSAADKPKGQTLLTLAHLSGFEAVPDDLNRVLAETRKNYPPPDGDKK